MAAIKPHKTATVDIPWDGQKNKSNVKTGQDLAYYSKIFAWRDPEGDESVKSTYKFVHHEVSADGTPSAANTVGCSTGIGVLNGGMGGTIIPDADRQGVYDHLAKHIRDAGKEPPPLNKKARINAAMPHPSQGEGEGAFMMRCMNDPLMTKECPDENQRYDVCEALFGDDEPKGPGMDKKKASIPRIHPRGYEIKAQAQDAEIWIYEEIGESWMGGGFTAKTFAEDLKNLGKVQKINLHLNSPGGVVWDGIAIYNLLKQCQARVTVHIEGLAASIASVIAMAGDEVIMAENALMMIHNPWGMTIGNAADHRQAADMLDKIGDSIVMAYLDKQKKMMNPEQMLPQKEKMAALMDAETWMSAQEAMDHCLVDKICAPMEMAASFDLSKFKYRKTPERFKAGNMDIRQRLARQNITCQRIKAACGQR